MSDPDHIMPAQKPTPAPKLVIQHYSAFFDRRPALRDLSLELYPSERLAIIGPAGSGKSTLLRSLNRLNDLVPNFTHTGRILLDGHDILGSAVEVSNLRRRLGLVNSHVAPLPVSVFENIAIGLKLGGVRDRERLRQLVAASLEQVELWPEVKDRLDESASRLTGEQQYRLCLARVLALEPEILLLDEPCAGLDPISTSKIEDMLSNLKSRFPMILVTNNNPQAARCSDRTAFVLNGELVECSPTHQLFFNPTQIRTSDFITGR